MTTNQLKEALETRNWRYRLLWLRCKLLDIHPSSVRMSGMVMAAGYIDICPVCGKVHNIPMWQMMWNEYQHSRRLNVAYGANANRCAITKVKPYGYVNL